MLLSTFHCTGDAECVGARTKLNMRGCPHCPLCFLQYFYPADFNVIISPVVPVRWKTHPPSNNTPLSIRGTETHAHTEFTVRTLKSVIWTWIKHKVLTVGPCRLPFAFYPRNTPWSHPGRAGRDSLVRWCRWSGRRGAKKQKAFCPQWPRFDPTNHTIRGRGQRSSGEID